MRLAYEALASIIYPKVRKLFSEGMEKMHIMAVTVKNWGMNVIVNPPALPGD